MRILELADEPSTGIGRVGSLAGEPSAGIGVVPCESLSSPMGFARHHTDPRRGFAGERSDTPDPCRGFIGVSRIRTAQGWARHHSESAATRPIPVEGSSASSRIRTAPQRERSDTPDPCRGFIGELKDAHGTTARALRHARSL